MNSFNMDQLEFKTLAECSYLESDNIKYLFFYQAQLWV